MIYAVKIVNKRPRNLLNEIQNNVFINGKQVKTAKITQIIPWFYATKTTGNSQRPYTHMCHVDNAYRRRFQLADGLKVGRRDISKF